MYLHLSKMSNIEHRPVMKFFTRKGLNAIEISKDVYKDSAPLSPIGWLSSTIQNTVSKMHLEWAPSHYTTKHRSPTTDQNASLCPSSSWTTDDCPSDDEHEEGLHKVDTEIVDTLIIWIVGRDRSKSEQVFSFYRNWQWVLDSPLRSSEVVKSEELKEVRWTNTNSATPRKISWKDDDDDFLG